MTYPEPDRYPAAETEEVVERTHPRIRIVRTVNALVHLVCVLCALVLAVHIVLVFGEANAANGFARLVDHWSASVSLGLRNLFTPDGAKLRTLLNDGLAAIIWLVLGAVVTDLVTRIGIPGPKRIWYRRALR